MKIAISAQNNSLNAEVDPRFGRCKFFVLVDTETAKHQILENKAANADSGAGIQSAQLIVDQGVKAVYTGRVGPKASQVLQAGKVKINEGITGRVNDVIEKLKVNG